MDNSRIALPVNSITCPVAPRRADAADHRKDQVLGVHPVGQLAVYLDPHVAALGLCQALGRQYVLHFGSSDSLREGGEGTVCRGMRVAANDGHARQCRALLRADDMDNALAHVVDAELLDAEVTAIGIERLHLDAGDFVGDALDPGHAFAAHRGHVVVGRRQVRAHAPGRPASQPQSLERLRRGDLVQKVPVHVHQAHAVGALSDPVRVPYLVVERLAAHT